MQYFKGFFYEKFKILGDFFGFKCRGCKHLTEKHIQIERGRYKCADCDDNYNICYLNDKEIENFLKTIKNFLFQFHQNIN